MRLHRIRQASQSPIQQFRVWILFLHRQLAALTRSRQRGAAARKADRIPSKMGGVLIRWQNNPASVASDGFLAAQWQRGFTTAFPSTSGVEQIICGREETTPPLAEGKNLRCMSSFPENAVSSRLANFFQGRERKTLHQRSMRSKELSYFVSQSAESCAKSSYGAYARAPDDRSGG
jgi:hypothetical protein